jgi:p-cumate 2,3-dioxygenase subunit alpha
MSVRSYIVDDREKKTFLLDREVLVSEDVLRREMAQIFGRCWIYVGHSSELTKPGDFRSRKVAGRPVIFCRDQAGAFHCLFNTCRHRGAMVCTERAGNRRRFQCIYHGWTYGNDGRLVGVPGADAYAESFDKSTYGLRRPARFEEYRGFWFMCLDPDVAPLSDYLTGAKDYIDLVTVASNFVCYRYRRYERIREYVGAYLHVLKRTGDSFRIKERRVIIDAHELGALGSVSFIL